MPPFLTRGLLPSILLDYLSQRQIQNPKSKIEKGLLLKKETFSV